MLTKPLQKHFYRKYRTQLIFLIDLVITAFSYFMSFLIVSLNFRFDHLHILPIWVIMDGLFVSLGAYLISFQLFGVPKSIWKYTGPSEVIRIVGAVTTAVLLSLSIRPLYVHYGLEARMIVVNGVFTVKHEIPASLYFMTFPDGYTASGRIMGQLWVAVHAIGSGLSYCCRGTSSLAPWGNTIPAGNYHLHFE